MTRAQKIMLVVIGILVLILVLLIVFSRPSGERQAPINVNSQPTNSSTLPVNEGAGSFNANVSTNANTAVPTQPADQANNLRRIAGAFAERYGSFSNAGNYQNLLDLGPFMTASLRAATEAYVEAQRANPPSAEYRGTTTRSISVSVDALDESAGTATLTVNTQRREQGSTIGSETVYYQQLMLTFAKSGETWLVDTAGWQPR